MLDSQAQLVYKDCLLWLEQKMGCFRWSNMGLHRIHSILPYFNVSLR